MRDDFLGIGENGRTCYGMSPSSPSIIIQCISYFISQITASFLFEIVNCGFFALIQANRHIVIPGQVAALPGYAGHFSDHCPQHFTSWTSDPFLVSFPPQQHRSAFFFFLIDINSCLESAGELLASVEFSFSCFEDTSRKLSE